MNIKNLKRSIFLLSLLMIFISANPKKSINVPTLAKKEMKSFPINKPPFNDEGPGSLGGGK